VDAAMLDCRLTDGRTLDRAAAVTRLDPARLDR
jgi:hypothetical protein